MWEERRRHPLHTTFPGPTPLRTLDTPGCGPRLEKQLAGCMKVNLLVYNRASSCWGDPPPEGSLLVHEQAHADDLAGVVAAAD